MTYDIPWVTRAGKRIFLDRMEDEHLLGAYRFVKKHVEKHPGLKGWENILGLEILRRDLEKK